MLIIEKGIPLPINKLPVINRKISPLAASILETLGACDLGDSFVVEGLYKRVAMIAGRMGSRLGYGIKTAPEEGDSTRIWRIAPRVKRAKRAAKAA